MPVNMAEETSSAHEDVHVPKVAMALTAVAWFWTAYECDTIGIDVFDMQGRPVFSGKCEKGSIELNGFSEGLYVVRVRNGSASLTKRIAIK